MKEYTDNGIMYTWALAGPNGASFMLFPTEINTPIEIKEAKQWLRDNHDVVYLSIAKEEDHDELYRAEIFRVPATHSLKWYQMNADNLRLIRKCRKAGVTPQQYVKMYVMPCIEKTEKQNLKEHGSKMYDL